MIGRLAIAASAVRHRAPEAPLWSGEANRELLLDGDPTQRRTRPVRQQLHALPVRPPQGLAVSGVHVIRRRQRSAIATINEEQHDGASTLTDQLRQLLQVLAPALSDRIRESSLTTDAQRRVLQVDVDCSRCDRGDFVYFSLVLRRRCVR